jgi:hypothetical protein
MLKPFDPRQYLDLARDMARHSSDETVPRTAVGRAYYAVFLMAREAAHVHAAEQQQHQVIKTHLLKHDNAVGGAYGSLYDLRIEADYYLEPRDRANDDWARNWRYADRYASTVVEYLSKPPR